MRTALRRSGRRVELNAAAGDDARSELAVLRAIGSSPLPEDVVERSALGRLIEHYRHALVNHHIDEQKIGDYACGRGITETAARSRSPGPP